MPPNSVKSFVVQVRYDVHMNEFIRVRISEQHGSAGMRKCTVSRNHVGILFSTVACMIGLIVLAALPVAMIVIGKTGILGWWL